MSATEPHRVLLRGADPKSELDADLARLETYLETSRPARDASALRAH